jgi:PAS domain S-box-containing protein
MQTKILIVDDRPENLLVLEQILQYSETTIISVTSGNEALQMVLEHDFALILMDVQMPVMDGFETAQLIRNAETEHHVPIIFVTAISKEQSHVFQGYESGAVDYMFKPIDPQILKSKVRVFLDLDRQRRELSNALEENKQLARKNQLLLKCAGEGIIGVDLEGFITFINPAALRMLEQEEDVTGIHIFKVIYHKNSPDIPETWEESAIYGSGIGSSYQHVEKTTFWRPGGDSFPVEFSSAALYEEESGFSGAVVVFQDITAKKAAEAEKDILRNQLQQAHKMEAIGTLASGVAHNFNNILTAIMGYTEIVSYNLDPESKVKDDLNEIMKAGRRAKELVKQILAFSHKSESKTEPIQASIIIRDVVKLLKATVPANIIIQDEIDEESSTSLLDPVLIHQVLMNLGTNAYYSMLEKGGTLKFSLNTITLSDFDNDTLSLPPGSYLQLCVSDTGSGMDNSTRDRVFEPFFTTKPVGEGTGLGLSLVYGIISDLKGDISIQSELQKGTVFKVLIPCCDKPEITEKEETTAEIETGSGRILFVDDETPLITLGEKVLTLLGYEFTGVTSADAAMEELKKQPGYFDLVISDYAMPKKTGIKLAEEIKKIAPEVPVLIATGTVDDISLAQIENMTVDNLISKPYIISELAKAVKKAISS